MYHITLELTNILLPIYQKQSPHSFLEIVHKLSLVSLPVLLQVVKVCELELLVQLCRDLVVDTSFSIESVVDPVALVSEFLGWVVEFSITVHCSIFPFSIIDSPIVIAEFSFSMP